MKTTPDPWRIVAGAATKELKRTCRPRRWRKQRWRRGPAEVVRRAIAVARAHLPNAPGASNGPRAHSDSLLISVLHYVRCDWATLLDWEQIHADVVAHLRPVVTALNASPYLACCSIDLQQIAAEAVAQARYCWDPVYERKQKSFQWSRAGFWSTLRLAGGMVRDKLNWGKIRWDHYDVLCTQLSGSFPTLDHAGRLESAADAALDELERVWRADLEKATDFSVVPPGRNMLFGALSRSRRSQENAAMKRILNAVEALARTADASATEGDRPDNSLFRKLDRKMGKRLFFWIESWLASMEKAKDHTADHALWYILFYHAVPPYRVESVIARVLQSKLKLSQEKAEGIAHSYLYRWTNRLLSTMASSLDKIISSNQARYP